MRHADRIKTVVFLDLETTGLDNPPKCEITQIGLVAVNFETLNPFEMLEIKMRFDASAPGAREALKIQQNYSPEVWDAEAIDPSEAWSKIKGFLRRHENTLISQKGRPYGAVRAAGHNISVFDLPFLKAWWGMHAPSTRWDDRLGIEFDMFDTRQIADILRTVYGREFDDVRLETLAQYYGVTQESQEHDAVDDIMLNIEVFRHLVDDLTQTCIGEAKCAKALLPSEVVKEAENDLPY